MCALGPVGGGGGGGERVVVGKSGGGKGGECFSYEKVGDARRTY